jgi:malate dehydrogenase (oxaloacetate-decarboxylating)
VLAGLINALIVTGKQMENVRIAMVGMGAANVATYRLLCKCGVDPGAIIACDRNGTLHRKRFDIEQQQTDFADKWRVCQESNAGQIKGRIADALRDADVCLAFSTPGPDVILPEWIQSMAPDAIVFAGSNPVPEIWPWQAKQAGAKVVATGRSDFPNQVNNSLGFPAIFRGVLDVRASQITDEMAIAAAGELAQFAQAKQMDEDHIVPRMDQWEFYPQVAAVTGTKAIEQGIAALKKSPEELYKSAFEKIRFARDATHSLMNSGLIPEPPI